VPGDRDAITTVEGGDIHPEMGDLTFLIGLLDLEDGLTAVDDRLREEVAIIARTGGREGIDARWGHLSYEDCLCHLFCSLVKRVGFIGWQVYYTMVEKCLHATN